MHFFPIPSHKQFCSPSITSNPTRHFFLFKWFKVYSMCNNCYYNYKKKSKNNNIRVCLIKGNNSSIRKILSFIENFKGHKSKNLKIENFSKKFREIFSGSN